MCARQVLSPHTGGKTVLSAVRQLDGLFLRLEGADREYWPEDLFLHDPSRRILDCENRGRNEESAAGHWTAADKHLCARLHGIVDVGQDSRPLALRDHRA